MPSFADRYLGFRFARGQAAPGGPEGPGARAEPARARDGRSPSGAFPGRGLAEAPNLITGSEAPTHPSWATSGGTDQFGVFADVVLPAVRRSTNDVSFRMRLVPAGQFMMGSPETEQGRFDGEGPQHLVTLTRGYWMADAPCTQALYEVVTGSNPSHFQGADRPVEQVSWEDTQRFLESLNDKIRGLALQLPTEAQWEYACRAGTEGPRYHEPLDAIGWFSENSVGQTHPIRAKEPNSWGLYDTLGNVYEWCQDIPTPVTAVKHRLIPQALQRATLAGGPGRVVATTTRGTAGRRTATRTRAVDRVPPTWAFVLLEVRLRQVARRAQCPGRSPKKKTAERSGLATHRHRR